MNIKNLIRQCRTEQRLGRLSAECQQRIMRRVGRIQLRPEETRWGHLMGMLRQIHGEIAEKRNALIRARWEVFRTKDDRPINVPWSHFDSTPTPQVVPQVVHVPMVWNEVYETVSVPVNH